MGDRTGGRARPDRKTAASELREEIDFGIGGAGDGGYLVPDDLDGIEYCFSPGVNLIS